MDSLGRRKRPVVKNPCYYCKEMHTRCSQRRPCERCERLGLVCFTANSSNAVPNIVEFPQPVFTYTSNGMLGPPTSVGYSTELPVQMTNPRNLEESLPDSPIPRSVIHILSNCVESLETAVMSVSVIGCDDILKEEQLPDHWREPDDVISQSCREVFVMPHFQCWCDMLSGSHSGVICWRVGGMILYATHGYARNMGYCVEELLGMNLLSMVHHGEMNTELQFYYERIMNSESRGYERGGFLKHKSGDLVRIYSIVGIIREVDHHTAALLAFVHFPDSAS